MDKNKSFNSFFPVQGKTGTLAFEDLWPAKGDYDFNDLVIGSWSGVDILVDPYSQSINGKVRIVVSAYFDAKPRRATSFKYGYMN